MNTDITDDCSAVEQRSWESPSACRVKKGMGKKHECWHEHGGRPLCGVWDQKKGIWANTSTCLIENLTYERPSHGNGTMNHQTRPFTTTTTTSSCPLPLLPSSGTYILLLGSQYPCIYNWSTWTKWSLFKVCHFNCHPSSIPGAASATGTLEVKLWSLCVHEYPILFSLATWW
jgi:hypothetical protein